jgi:hypothetical protein
MALTMRALVPFAYLMKIRIGSSSHFSATLYLIYAPNPQAHMSVCHFQAQASLACPQCVGWVTIPTAACTSRGYSKDLGLCRSMVISYVKKGRD